MQLHVVARNMESWGAAALEVKSRSLGWKIDRALLRKVAMAWASEGAGMTSSCSVCVYPKLWHAGLPIGSRSLSCSLYNIKILAHVLVASREPCLVGSSVVAQPLVCLCGDWMWGTVVWEVKCLIPLGSHKLPIALCRGSVSQGASCLKPAQ